MTGTEQDPIVFMERLRKQIDELTHEQINALKQATYVGMTPDDAKAYDARRIKITSLTQQLAEVRQAQTS